MDFEPEFDVATLGNRQRNHGGLWYVKLSSQQPALSPGYLVETLKVQIWLEHQQLQITFQSGATK